MELCSGAKVTPLVRPCDPLLLPLTDVFLMIPEQKQHLCHRVSIMVTAAVVLRCCPPTCRGQSVQSLQAVFSGRMASCLREATLALVQHGSRRDDARGRGFPHPQVQGLDLFFLGDLQVLHLHQVSDVGQTLELSSLVRPFQIGCYGDRADD